MTIKLQCNCGTKYSFEVEPTDHRMPFPVNCPSCHADGTEAANKIIADSVPGPKLRINSTRTSAPGPATLVPAPQNIENPCCRHPHNPAADHCVVCQKPICLECMGLFGYLCSVSCRYQAEQRGITVPAYQFQKTAVEHRQYRKAGWIALGVLALFLAMLGAWIWYIAVGSRPRLAYALPLDHPAHIQYFGPGRMLELNSSRVALYDLKAKKYLWSTSLNASAANDFVDSTTPQFFAGRDYLWICPGDRVLCVNAASGEIKKSVPISGRLESFTPAESSILVVSARDETKRIALRIEMPSGEVRSREIVVPRSATKTLPDELPANVAPTAGVLLKQMEDDQKFNRGLNAISSEFFSAGENLIELRTTLVTPKVTTVQTMRPKGPSHINGNTTVSTSAGAVFEEVFNDIKRSNTGGFRNVDESHYQVLLRRWTSDARPVEWKGDVSGVPMFFSLPTVDLLVAGKTLAVFDKQNKKLFESKLANPISELFSTYNPGHHLVPAIQTADSLCFFDQGTMTAFDLPGGNVRWRLTSIGISRAQFDGQGALYVDSTSASPEDIQYPDQIKLEKIAPVILKVEEKSGKILWQTQGKGRQCFLSGKFLYATSTDLGGVGLANALSEALEQPQRDVTAYFRVYRLDPATGRVLWDFDAKNPPDSISFQNNQFLLGFDREVQLVKYLSF